MRLEGHTAIVTGAARGIGRVTALALAERGANVAVADLNEQVEETAAAVRDMGRKAIAVTFDVSDHAAAREGVARIASEVGAPDIVVSNAGIVSNIAPLAKMEPAAWQRELQVNLTGAFNLVQATIGPMIERQWGRIVVVSSGAAQTGAHYQSAYAASKAGLLGLVKTVTIEHARHGITCNAILPGLIETENVRQMPAEIVETVRIRTPARRLGRMDDIANLVAFLASDDAAFINGAEINIDGGLRLSGVPLGSRRELQEQHGG